MIISSCIGGFFVVGSEKMNLNLENGCTVTLPSKGKHNIYYGPNKIDKTQISHSMKKYYEEISEEV